MPTHDYDIISMEEGRAEPIVGKQAIETRRGNDQNTKHRNEMRNDRIKQRLKSLDDVYDEKSYEIPDEALSIPRVPTTLRENENLKAYFEPRVVSIGPYHHGKGNLKVTEEMKRKLAAMFLKENFVVDKEELYSRIRGEIEDLKKCYELDATKDYDDDDLAWMFFIDGCVVMHFIFWGTYKTDREIVARSTLDMDLLLLENQLPFRVLELLINSSECREILMVKMHQSIRFTTRNAVQENQKPPLENPAHLLDLIRKTFQTEFFIDNESSNFTMQRFKKLSGFLSYLSFVIELPLCCILLPNIRAATIDVTTIQELTEFGIDLKPIDKSCVSDITFSNGALKLPRIYIDDSTVFMFLNLIAYEKISPETIFDRFNVSAYIFFLTSFITQEEDVKQLQVNNILFNNFNSNKDVVKLFKKMSTVDFPQSSRQLHSTILWQIQSHCKNKYRVLIGQFRKRYFDSPWSMIATVGAVTILILTFLQTIYTGLGYHTEQTAKL